tara:strand:+ start:135 stop:674 length:540 start_codon:yes stop_codon:yes gene_type:complete
MPKNKYQNFLNKYSSQILSLTDTQSENFIKVCKMIKKINKKGKIIVCGNGGSSSIASHVAVDISKILRIKAITFADDNLITCFANDYGYDKWTSEALKIYSNTNDLVILISSSGSSKNIVNAAKFAKKQGNPLITLSGFKENNPLKKIGDVNVWVNSNSYNHIEMAHHIFLVAVIDCLK